MCLGKAPLSYDKEEYKEYQPNTTQTPIPCKTSPKPYRNGSNMRRVVYPIFWRDSEFDSRHFSFETKGLFCTWVFWSLLVRKKKEKLKPHYLPFSNTQACENCNLNHFNQCKGAIGAGYPDEDDVSVVFVSVGLALALEADDVEQADCEVPPLTAEDVTVSCCFARAEVG